MSFRYCQSLALVRLQTRNMSCLRHCNIPTPVALPNSSRKDFAAVDSGLIVGI